jgi:hypothetical protein
MGSRDCCIYDWIFVVKALIRMNGISASSISTSSISTSSISISVFQIVKPLDSGLKVNLSPWHQQ